MTNRFKIFILIILSIGTGCKSTKDIVYFQDGEQKKVVYPNFEEGKNKMQTYEAIIQTNDILSIYVSSLSPEATTFFNESNINAPDQTGGTFITHTSIGYLVDSQGFIEMPLIGKVKVAGLTTVIAKDTLLHRLQNYLEDPMVRIYFENFRVTLLGEVKLPGVYTVTNEKLSLTEAIGLAGDLTPFGNRKNVMLIREENGEKKFVSLDLTKRDLFTSPYYYLHSNDVLYIEPVKARAAQTDNIYRLLPLIISIITLGVVLSTQYNLNN